MKQNTTTLFFIGALGSMLIASGCSPSMSQKDVNQMSAAEKQQFQQEQIDNYFVGLSDWSKISPLKADEKSATGQPRQSTEKIWLESEEGNQTVPATCTTQDFDLTKTPEKIVMQDPAAGVLYPGALIQGEGYLQGPGGLRELPIRKRSPMIIATDLVQNQNAVEMKTVNYATYAEAHSKLLAAASKNEFKSIGRAMFTQIEASRSEQAALDLGFSVKYMGSSLSGDMQSKSSTNENVFMVVFEQNAYTVSAVIPATPAGFFSSDFTPADLKTQEALGNISVKNPPLYVSSVTYGRMLIYTVTSKASKSDIQGALNASYKNPGLKVDIKLKAKYQKILNDSKVKIIFFGGDNAPSVAMIKNGDINDYFSKTPSLDSFVPMSYVLRNLKDNSIAKVSETTKYSTQECTPISPKSWTVQITIDKILMKYTGAYSKGEIYGNLFLNGTEVWSRTRAEYAPTKNGASLDIATSRNTRTVDLPTVQPKHVMMTGQFADVDDIFADDKLATINEKIGYDGSGQVLPDGSYKALHNRHVEISYSIKRLKANY
ncbi:MAG: thiol-activated cytolysin family protein [Moraxellaceae bacterium]|nr:thiol-activated cytolysin family protein [Pseudobdellovibrionaceae bacterium]